METYLEIASIGFADDLSTFSESWFHHWTKHEWIRAFFWAHSGDINVIKTEYIISDASKEDPRWLYSIDGSSAIVPSPPSTVFRFLGIFTSMDLNWSKQAFLMEKSIIDWGLNVKKSEISSIKTLETYKIYLLPRLELGLTFANISMKTCKRWSRRILKTIMSADSHPAELATKLSTSAFSFLTNCPLILERKNANQLRELIYCLNSEISHAGLTSWARIYNLRKSYRLDSLYKTHLYKHYRFSRHAELIEYWHKQGVCISNSTTSILLWIPKIKDLTEFLRTASSQVTIFTDGSSDKSSTISGIGIYAVDKADSSTSSLALPILSYGNNYLAELAALTLAVKAIPPDSLITIYSDSLSSIASVNKPRLLNGNLFGLLVAVG
jgi:hypothetical protein